MKLKRYWILGVITLAAAGFVLMLGGGLVSAQSDAYVTVSPASACIGDMVTFSGRSEYPGTVYVSMTNDVQAADVGTNLGTTVNDSGWSLTTNVPDTGRDMNFQPKNIIPGSYTVVADQGSEDSPIYRATGHLEVIDCTGSNLGSMPSTGFPAAPLAPAGAGLLVAAATGFGIRKLRRLN